MRMPRKSIAPIAINKYRRRLSLAVPEPESEGARRRGLSSGNVLKCLDSPARRRLRFRKGDPRSMTSEDRSESANMFALTGSIREDDEENQSDDIDNIDTHNPDKEYADPLHDSRDKGAIRHVINSGVQHGSLKRTKSSDPHTPSPCDKERRKGGSFKGQASKQGAKLSDRGVKFVSPKHSPSAMRRKALIRSQTEDSGTKVVPSQVESTPEKSAESTMRKNTSYSKALSSDIINNAEGVD